MHRNVPEDRAPLSEADPAPGSKPTEAPVQRRSQQVQEDQCLTGKQLNQSLKYKTELCRNYQSGFCEFQDKCSFAHGPDELRALIPRTAKYKTKYCKQFFEAGYCMYGSKCQFKHEDLQPTAPSSRKGSEGGRLPIFVDIEKRGEEQLRQSLLL